MKILVVDDDPDMLAVTGFALQQAGYLVVRANSFGTALATFRARVDNVTDRNYWASVGGYPGYGYLVLGAPRTFTVSATIDF